MSEKNFSQTRCYATVKSQLCSCCEVCTSSREKLFPLLGSPSKCALDEMKNKGKWHLEFSFRDVFSFLFARRSWVRNAVEIFSRSRRYISSHASPTFSLLSFNLKCRASNNVLSLFFVRWILEKLFSSFVWSLQKEKRRENYVETRRISFFLLDYRLFVTFWTNFYSNLVLNWNMVLVWNKNKIAAGWFPFNGFKILSANVWSIFCHSKVTGSETWVMLMFMLR